MKYMIFTKKNIVGEADLLPTSGLHRTHLFLLPGSSQINRACSRQPSLRTCRLRYTGTGAFGSGIGSETVTTVTSQLDEDDDDERAFDMNNGEYDIDLFHENDINNNINNESQLSTKSGFHGDEYILNGEVPWQYGEFHTFYSILSVCVSYFQRRA